MLVAAVLFLNIVLKCYILNTVIGNTYSACVEKSSMGLVSESFQHVVFAFWGGLVWLQMQIYP